MPNAMDWEDAKSIPPEVYQQGGKDGLLVPFAAGIRIPKGWVDPSDGRGVIADVPAEEWDSMHDMIMTGKSSWLKLRSDDDG